jgi:sugar lactone lactonase YvrE
LSRSPKRALGAAIAGAGAILATTAALGAAGALSAGPQPPTVVADNISNPRGLELTSKGLYVAAAGKGGGKKCINSPEAGTICPGTTSKVVRVNLTTGEKTRLAKGLPSYAGSDGSFATGNDDVSVAPDGGVFGIETFAPKKGTKLLPKKARKLNGRVLRIEKGAAHRAGHISKFERNHDPDGQGFDSDPYGIYAASESTQYVVDAAGNDVLRVHNGHIKLVAVLPSIGKNEAVPTSITRGPNGDLFVGEFVGEAKPSVDRARVIEISPAGQQTVYATGLNRITGLSFDLAGNLFVTELSTRNLTPTSHGAIVEVPAKGPKCTVSGSTQLHFPAGGVVTGDGSTLYVSNFSVLPGETSPSGPFGGAHGQVVSLPATTCH